MKYSKTIGRIVTSLLPLLVLASASFAATNPLANPFGMAVDAKGNLWVANGQGGKSQLVQTDESHARESQFALGNIRGFGSLDGMDFTRDHSAVSAGGSGEFAGEGPRNPSADAAVARPHLYFRLQRMRYKRKQILFTIDRTRHGWKKLSPQPAHYCSTLHRPTFCSHRTSSPFVTMVPLRARVPLTWDKAFMGGT
jgi:hypothetical protein